MSTRKPHVGANVGTYTRIPNAVLISAGFRRMNPTYSKALLLLWFHVASDDPYYEVWPGPPRLSYLIGVESEGTAERAVSSIVNAGLAYWGPGRRHRDARGRPLQSLYLLVPGEPAVKMGNQKSASPSAFLDQKSASLSASPNKEELDVREPEELREPEAPTSGSPPPPAPTSGSSPSCALANAEPDAGELPQKEPDGELPAHLAKWQAINDGDRLDAMTLLAARHKNNETALARLEAVRAGREPPSPTLVAAVVEAIPGRADHRGSKG